MNNKICILYIYWLYWLLKQSSWYHQPVTNPWTDHKHNIRCGHPAHCYSHCANKCNYSSERAGVRSMKYTSTQRQHHPPGRQARLCCICCVRSSYSGQHPAQRMRACTSNNCGGQRNRSPGIFASADIIINYDKLAHARHAAEKDMLSFLTLGIACRRWTGVHACVPVWARQSVLTCKTRKSHYDASAWQWWWVRESA